MNPESKAHLTLMLELPGSAAWCVCAAGPTFEYHCYTDWFKPPQLESIVSKLTGTMEELRRRQIEAFQLCWVFEHARLFLAQRADGATLVLFVENRPGLNVAKHQAAVAEFAVGE